MARGTMTRAEAVQVLRKLTRRSVIGREIYGVLPAGQWVEIRRAMPFHEEGGVCLDGRFSVEQLQALVMYARGKA